MKKLSKKVLTKILDKHKAWAEVRAMKKGGADLIGADLRGFDSRGVADLRDADSISFALLKKALVELRADITGEI